MWLKPKKGPLVNLDEAVAIELVKDEVKAEFASGRCVTLWKGNDAEKFFKQLQKRLDIQDVDNLINIPEIRGQDTNQSKRGQKPKEAGN
jgi:hypothetical protein